MKTITSGFRETDHFKLKSKSLLDYKISTCNQELRYNFKIHSEFEVFNEIWDWEKDEEKEKEKKKDQSWKCWRTKCQVRETLHQM